jgi:hypothetical protein
MTAFEYQAAIIRIAIVNFFFGRIDETGMMRAEKTGRRQQVFIITEIAGNKNGFTIGQIKFR